MTKIENHQDRRTTPRYTVDLPARLWGETDASQRVEIENGTVCDVSWGGLFIKTGANQPVGAEMGLLVTLPQLRDPVPLRGRVAWRSNGGAKGPGLGIQLQTSL